MEPCCKSGQKLSDEFADIATQRAVSFIRAFDLTEPVERSFWYIVHINNTYRSR